jgi:hypothetical protein
LIYVFSVGPDPLRALNGFERMLIIAALHWTLSRDVELEMLRLPQVIAGLI